MTAERDTPEGDLLRAWDRNAVVEDAQRTIWNLRPAQAKISPVRYRPEDVQTEIAKRTVRR